MILAQLNVKIVVLFKLIVFLVIQIIIYFKILAYHSVHLLFFKILQQIYVILVQINVIIVVHQQIVFNASNIIIYIKENAIQIVLYFIILIQLIIIASFAIRHNVKIVFKVVLFAQVAIIIINY